MSEGFALGWIRSRVVVILPNRATATLRKNRHATHVHVSGDGCAEYLTHYGCTKKLNVFEVALTQNSFLYQLLVFYPSNA